MEKELEILRKLKEGTKAISDLGFTVWVDSEAPKDFNLYIELDGRSLVHVRVLGDVVSVMGNAGEQDFSFSEYGLTEIVQYIAGELCRLLNDDVRGLEDEVKSLKEKIRHMKFDRQPLINGLRLVARIAADIKRIRKVTNGAD